MDEACATEVVELHRFIERWLTGVLPKTDEAFARFAAVMGEGFVIVSPAGVTTPRDELLGELRAGHGSRADDFDIRIDNLAIRRDLDPLCVVTYEEWQRSADERTARIATALFGPRADAPNGVEWLHLHETWKRGHGPAA